MFSNQDLFPHSSCQSNMCDRPKSSNDVRNYLHSTSAPPQSICALGYVVNNVMHVHTWCHDKNTVECIVLFHQIHENQGFT